MNIFTFLNTEHVSGSELCIVIASGIFFFLINTYYLNSASQ